MGSGTTTLTALPPNDCAGFRGSDPMQASTGAPHRSYQQWCLTPIRKPAGTRSMTAFEGT